MRNRWFVVLAGLACLLLAVPLAAETPAATAEVFGHLPLIFEPNLGQTDPSVRFLSRGNRYGFFLTETEAVISLMGPVPAQVRMQLVGQNPHPQISGAEVQPGTSQYIKGTSPQKWQGAVPHYRKVEYREVYPGVDLTYYGNQQQLEYDFTVAPQADPRTIQLKFSGVDRIALDDQGELILHTAAGEIRHQRPRVYQLYGKTERDVPADFVLLDSSRVGFKVGKYDKSLPLVIDPKILYATYFGGAGLNGDIGIDLKVDALGTTYVTGYTSSVDFFTTNLEPSAPGGKLDAFLLKVNPSGSTVIAALYFGGSSDDEGHRIALDDAGDIYITGFTSSVDFPIVNGFQTKLAGRRDSYIAKINNAANTLLFSSYLGGSFDDQPYGLSVDANHNIYIAGETQSSNFPLVAPLHNRFSGGLADGFVTKLTPAGELVYSTYIGGRGNDRVYDVTSDAAGNAYIVGYTSSIDFPHINSIMPQYQGGAEDAFVAKLSPNGDAYLISTFLGGSQSEEAVRVALDSAGNIVVAGYTISGDFPLRSPVQAIQAGAFDIFLTKLTADGSDILFSTYFGSDGSESAPGLALDSEDNIYFAGFTSSFTFPVVNGIDVGTTGGNLKGDRDAYVAKIGANGKIFFSTYIGGSFSDGAVSLALDKLGNVYLTGYTFSANFPVLNAFQPTLGNLTEDGTADGTSDGFLIKLNAEDVVATTPMLIPSKGGVALATVGSSNRIDFAHGTFSVPNGALLPAGMAIVDLRQQGAEVTEAAFPLLPFITDGRVYVNDTTGPTTNLAIVNPSESPVDMYWFFTNRIGTRSNYGGITIPAKSSFAQPVNNFPIFLPFGTAGTLTFSTTAPIAALAFRTNTEATNAVVINYLPIVDPYHFETRPTTIAQYAADQTWGSEFLLVNNTESPMTGVVRFYNNGPNEGDPTKSSDPIALDTDRGNLTEVPYNLVPLGSDSFSLGSPGATVSGYAMIIPDAGTFTPVGTVVLAYTQNSVVTLRATVEAQVPANDFRLYNELSGDFDNGEGFATAMAFALSNPAETPTTITLTLVDMDGTSTGLTSTFTLPPRGHLASYLHRMAGFQNIPKPFQGVLLVHATGDGVVAFSMRGRISENSNFVGTTTGPLKEHPGSGNIVIFPHILDGGGYATQFLLFNDPAGGATLGSLHFADENGQDLPLAIEQK